MYLLYRLHLPHLVHHVAPHTKAPHTKLGVTGFQGSGCFGFGGTWREEKPWESGCIPGGMSWAQQAVDVEVEQALQERTACGNYFSLWSVESLVPYVLCSFYDQGIAELLGFRDLSLAE